VVWAAFDFPAQPPARETRIRGRFLRPPAKVLRAETSDQVPAVVASAVAAANAGNWVLGGLSYSASATWDAAQVARRDDTPFAHFEVYAEAPEPWPADPRPLPALDWVPEVSLANGRTGRDAIQEVREHIAAGDCYQVNLTTRYRAAGEFWPLFEAVAAAQPGGYLFGSRLAGVGCASPELFFHLEDDRLVTQPMKGTSWTDAAALDAAKERAENLMIVDLIRNDLGRVCEPGSVLVDRLFEVHRLPTVWQLTSTVSGTVRAGTALTDVFAALFPCGSVTGAPKIAAMRVIADLESSARGWYCGALGVMRPGGTATFAVPIRTVVARPDGLVCSVGSGVVTDSDPDAELAEWRAKTAFLGGSRLRALETMLLVDGVLQRRTAHLARLIQTCDAHGLALDLVEVADALDLVAGGHPSGRWRVRLVAGDGPSEVISAPAPTSGEPMTLRLATESLASNGWLGPVVRHKTTLRSHYDRLRLPGCDDVICHHDGWVTECTMGNLAVLLDGQWLTPPESAGLLPGVLRAELLAAGRLREHPIAVADLHRAEDLAFLNSLRGWCPARLAEAPFKDSVSPSTGP